MKKVGIAFQGGGFPAGAIGAGVVRFLVENGAFNRYDIDVFSGTSAGALVASVCWGCKLKGNIEQAPDILRRQWMRFANGLVPDVRTAHAFELSESLAQLNPVYQFCSETLFVPLMRNLFRDWILEFIPVAELIRLRDQTSDPPGLLLGAADVLKGEIKVFGEKDFCLEAILASGSLDEINGITQIEKKPNAGVYCDGAWGTNPPLTGMIDYDIDELWFVEVFPKARSQIPRTPAERKDRKNELWQNSLVEHELYHIDKVNQWLASGRLKNADGKYHHIKIKPMRMEPDLTAGAAFVNSPAYIEEMMAYGYERAAVFVS